MKIMFVDRKVTLWIGTFCISVNLKGKVALNIHNDKKVLLSIFLLGGE